MQHSGLMMNEGKPKLYSSKGGTMKHTITREIGTQIIKLSISDLPVTYPGTPLSCSKLRRSDFN